MLRRLLLCVLSVLAVACAQTPPLLSPESLGQNVQVNQLVSVQSPEGDRQFHVVWSRERNVFRLAGLSLAGQLLFNIEQREGELQVRHALPEIPVKQLHQLVRQIQWAYWPLADINAAMPAGWAVTGVQDPPLRQVTRNGARHMAFQFENQMPFASVRIIQTQGPELQVTTLSVHSLDEQVQGRVQP